MKLLTQDELQVEFKKAIDRRIPECGEENCDVCQTRHIKLAKDLLDIFNSEFDIKYTDMYEEVFGFGMDHVVNEMRYYLTYSGKKTIRWDDLKRFGNEDGDLSL